MSFSAKSLGFCSLPSWHLWFKIKYALWWHLFGSFHFGLFPCLPDSLPDCILHESFCPHLHLCSENPSQTCWACTFSEPANGNSWDSLPSSLPAHLMPTVFQLTSLTSCTAVTCISLLFLIHSRATQTQNLLPGNQAPSNTWSIPHFLLVVYQIQPSGISKEYMERFVSIPVMQLFLSHLHSHQSLI